MSAQRPSSLNIQLTQARAFGGVLISLGIVVLIATIAVTGWPRAVSSVLTNQVRHTVSQTAPTLADVTTRLHIHGIGRANTLRSSQSAWDLLPDVLARVHARQPEPLRSVLSTGHYAARTDPYATRGPRANYHYNVQFEVSPRLRQDATIADGRWPRPFAPTYRSSSPSDITTAEPNDDSIEIVLGVATANRMGWKVGDTRKIALGAPSWQQKLTLVGTITPRAASPEFWRLDPLRNKPALENLGDGGFKLTAIAWMNPKPWPKLQYTFSSNILSGWFGVNADELTSANVAQVDAQLSALLSTAPASNQGLLFSSRLGETLGGYLSGAPPAQTLLYLLAAGPLGVALAVLVLGVGLSISRRRTAIALLTARGASGLRIRGTLAVEALAVSIPAAVLGTVLTAMLLPAARDGTTLILAACCALVPAATMAALATPAQPNDARNPGGIARWRPVAEVVVVAAAVIAVVVLSQRGLSGQSSGGQADPLVVLTPLLVCVAVCVLVLRVYPFALAGLAAALRRTRGAVGFVGAVRGERTSASTLVPVLAVLVGVAVTVFSSVVFSTATAGVEQAARGVVGADISVSASRLPQAKVKRIRHANGVAKSVTVSTVGFVNLSLGGTEQPVSVLVADTTALAKLQADLPDAVRTPAGIATKLDNALPILLGGWNQKEGVRDGELLNDTTRVAVHVAAAAAVPGGFISSSPWILMDASLAPNSLNLHPPFVTAVLIDDDQQMAGASLKYRVQRIAGADAIVRSAAERTDLARSTPIVHGLELLLIAAIALAVLACILAIILTLVMNAMARRRTAATMRTLGFSRGQNAALLAWEVGPILAAGLFGGLVTGIVLPFVVLAPLDLSTFTGGTVSPPIVVDGTLIALAAGGFLLVCAITVAIALVVAARRSAASILRTGEDE